MKDLGNKLVRTDYDNFRDMRFFVEQQRKAQAMMREVEEFTHSFLDSKLMTVEEVMSDYHNWITFEPGYQMEQAFKTYAKMLCERTDFIEEYRKNNNMSDYKKTKDYISEHIDYNEKTFKHYLKEFINEYNSDSNIGVLWTWLEKERPVWHHDYKNPWNTRITHHERYNPFGEFKHRHWDIMLSSPIIRWVKSSYWRSGKEYGERIPKFSRNDAISSNEIQDAYDKYPDIKIYKSDTKFIRGTVNQDVALDRIIPLYRKELDEVRERVLRYGMRVPGKHYLVMLSSDRAEAFKEHNLVFNPYTVKSIVDYKSQRLIPFMDENTKVNIEILDKVLRCIAIQKYQCDELRYFKDYDTHFIRKVVIDFDLNTNELVNVTESETNNKDIIWKEKI